MNGNLKALVFAASAMALATASAAKVESISVRSDAMKKDVPVSVILPDGYDASKNYPVVYLLHGAGGDHTTWTMPSALFLCDRHGFVGIAPDGDKTSWWWDAPADPTCRYETFVTRELIPCVEKKYPIGTTRTRRAVLGGSMGGHGACWLGFRHKDLFGAVGSIFGGVDIRPFPNNWGMAKRLGPLKGNERVWEEHCAITEAAKLRNGDVDLCMMIGTKDFFLDVNRAMHKLLAKNNVEHTYIEYTTEAPETCGHCRTFTTYAAPVMFAFFDNYFRTGSGQLHTGEKPHVGASLRQAAVPTAKKVKRAGWDDEKFTMGAIRWDAWYGEGAEDDLTTAPQVTRALSHPDHRWRLPFFADVAADGTVTIDGRKEGAMEREIDFAADHGIDYWAFLSYEKGLCLNNALPLYLKAKNRNRLKFCLVLRLRDRAKCDRLWPELRDRWAAALDEPGYMKVCGGRELVYVYPPVEKKYLDEFVALVKARGHNPYLVGMTYGKPAVRGAVAKNCAGMDAVGAYNFVGDWTDFGKMTDYLEENQWNAAAKDGLVLVPSLNAGFDASPRRDTEVSWQKGMFAGQKFHAPLTRAQLMDLTRRAKHFVLSHPTTCEAKTCLWYAWNEFDEGGWLCPTRRADGTPDTMRLEAVKAGLESGNDAASARRTALFRERLFSEQARTTFYEETVNAFRTHYDDCREDAYRNGQLYGTWQGEYWGKTMLSGAVVAEMTDSAEFKAWLREKALAFVAEYQQPDGYLCTYRHREFVGGKVGAKPGKEIFCWNLWGRKYTMWALIELARVCDEPKLLAAAAKMMDQEISQLEKAKVEIWDTGYFSGIPSMSVLKPLLLLYKATGTTRYLDFARHLVSGWERADGAKPNLVANAFSGKPLHAWYEDTFWAKAYEIMSCLEGLVEYAAVTGERKYLDAVVRLADQLRAHERNAVGSVGFGDKFPNAARMVNATTEVCDVIHWMRLTHVLYRATGDASYLDDFELAYLNGFVGGVQRDGTWAAQYSRSHGSRQQTADHQVGMKYHHCCVDNSPRAFADAWDAAVDVTKAGVLSVNLYSPIERTVDGARVTVLGNYPVETEIAVEVKPGKARAVRFRVPAWCEGLTVDGRVAEAKGGWFVTDVPADGHRFALAFARSVKPVPFVGEPLDFKATGQEWRFEMDWIIPETKGMARKTPGTYLVYGPVILAKSLVCGTSADEIFRDRLPTKPDAKLAIRPRAATETAGAWLLTVDGVEIPVCDYATASDRNDPNNRFSIWF